MTKLLSSITSALLACTCCLALAHGDAAHPVKAKAGVKFDQTDWGVAAPASQARRTLVVSMDDTMRFTPANITVKLGETVRLRVKNRGRAMHELVLGSRAELLQHAEMMKKFPNMEHDEPYMAHVPPGGERTIVWTFNRPGSFDFACLLPGHMDAGMTGLITVTP